jgi:hypothetical protein
MQKAGSGQFRTAQQLPYAEDHRNEDRKVGYVVNEDSAQPNPLLPAQVPIDLDTAADLLPETELGIFPAILKQNEHRGDRSHLRKPLHLHQNQREYQQPHQERGQHQHCPPREMYYTVQLQDTVSNESHQRLQRLEEEGHLVEVISLEVNEPQLNSPPITKRSSFGVNANRFVKTKLEGQRQLKAVLNQCLLAIDLIILIEVQSYSLHIDTAIQII